MPPRPPRVKPASLAYGVARGAWLGLVEKRTGVIRWLTGRWTASVGAAGLAGPIGAWLRGWLLRLVPVSCPQAGRFLRFCSVNLFRRPVVAKPEGHFLVAVCCLEGDDASGSAMRVVARAPRTEESLEPVPDWRRVPAGDGADQRAAELRARRRAQEIGGQYRADVIVCGEVATAGRGCGCTSRARAG